MMRANPSSDGLVKFLLLCAGFLGYIVPITLPLTATAMADDIGASVASVGVLAGLQGIVVAFASLLIGPVSDYYGPARLLSGFLLLNGLMLFAVAQSHDLHVLYLTGILNAVSFGPLVFCAMAYAGNHFSDERRAAAVGVISGAPYAGATLGLPLAAFFMSRPELSWRAAFMLFGVLSIASGVACLRILGVAATNSAPSSIRKVLAKYWEFIASPRLVGLLAIFLIVRFGLGMYYTYAAAYLLAARDFPATGFIYVYQIGGVLAFLVSLRIGVILAKVGSPVAIIGSSFCLIAAILLIVSCPTTSSDIVPVIAAICALYMVSEATRMAALFLEAVSAVGSAERGTFMGLINFLMHIGVALGALAGSAVLGLASGADRATQMQTGFSNIVVLTSLLWLASALLSILFTGQRKRAAAIPQ
jgi:predicted MFS family arabinose efflux permease